METVESLVLIVGCCIIFGYLSCCIYHGAKELIGFISSGYRSLRKKIYRIEFIKFEFDREGLIGNIGSVYPSVLCHPVYVKARNSKDAVSEFYSEYSLDCGNFLVVDIEEVDVLESEK